MSDLLGFEVVEFDDHEVRHHVCPSATDGGNALGPISERDAAKVGEEAPSLTCTDLGGPRSGYDVEVLHGALDQKFRVLVPRSVDLRKPSERSWWSDVSGGSIGFRTVRVDLWRRGAGLLHVTPMWPISPTSTLRRALELSSLRLGVLRRQGLVPVAPTTDLVPDGSKTWAFMDDRKHRRTVAIPIEGRSAPVLVKLYPQEYAFLQQLYAAAGRAVPIHEMPQRMSKERAKGVVSKIRSLLRKAGIAPAWINFALETADTGHRLRLREDTTETT